MMDKVISATAGILSILVFASMATASVFFMGEVWNGTIQALAHCSLLFVSCVVGACGMYSRICKMLDQ